MKKANQKKAQEVLSQAKLKLTKPRIEILAVLIEYNHPLTIEDIGKLIDPKINIVTIYRVLEKLSHLNLIYQTDFRNGKAYFEYQINHHHHIICQECNQTEAIETCLTGLSQSALKQSKKFKQINNHTLEFFGCCKKCQIKNSKPKA